MEGTGLRRAEEREGCVRRPQPVIVCVLATPARNDLCSTPRAAFEHELVLGLVRLHEPVHLLAGGGIAVGGHALSDPETDGDGFRAQELLVLLANPFASADGRRGTLELLRGQECQRVAAEDCSSTA